MMDWMGIKSRSTWRAESENKTHVLGELFACKIQRMQPSGFTCTKMAVTVSRNQPVDHHVFLCISLRLYRSGIEVVSILVSI